MLRCSECHGLLLDLRRSYAKTYIAAVYDSESTCESFPAAQTLYLPPHALPFSLMGVSGIHAQSTVFFLKTTVSGGGTSLLVMWNVTARRTPSLRRWGGPWSMCGNTNCLLRQRTPSRSSGARPTMIRRAARAERLGQARCEILGNVLNGARR
jgi:hypothetical protein